MNTSTRVALPLLATVLAAILGGCDGSEDGDTKTGSDGSGKTGASSSAGSGSTGSDGTGTDGSETDGSGTSGSTGGSGGSTSEKPLSHAKDIQPIWDEHCVTDCHEDTKTAAWPSFLMDADNAYETLFGDAAISNAFNPSVIKGKPDQSFLIRKLTVPGKDEGLRMPVKEIPPAKTGDLPDYKEDTPIEAADLEKIRSWIKQGAPK